MWASTPTRFLKFEHINIENPGSYRTVRDFAVSVNFDLAHAHGRKSVRVTFGCDTGAAGAVDRDGELGEGALGREHIRDDADVGAEADEFGRL